MNLQINYNTNNLGVRLYFLEAQTNEEQGWSQKKKKSSVAGWENLKINEP